MAADSDLTPYETSLMNAIAYAMAAALEFARNRDRLVAEGRTLESARDFLIAEYGEAYPVADLIEWFDQECAYTAPSFARILDAMAMSPQMKQDAIRSGLDADNRVTQMLEMAD